MTAVSPRRTGTGAPVVALVCLGLFMTTLDASIVNIALPSIARAFGTPLNGAVEWIIICYLLVVGGLLLTFGRLSDMVSRAPIWIAGLAIFTVGSAACGAAASLVLLIITMAGTESARRYARTQGAGTATSGVIVDTNVL